MIKSCHSCQTRCSTRTWNTSENKKLRCTWNCAGWCAPGGDPTVCRPYPCVRGDPANPSDFMSELKFMDFAHRQESRAIRQQLQIEKGLKNRSFMTQWVSLQMLVDCALWLKWPLKYDWYYMILCSYYLPCLLLKPSWLSHHPQPLSCQNKTCVKRLSLGMSHTIATAPRNSPDMHRPWRFSQS